MTGARLIVVGEQGRAGSDLASVLKGFLDHAWDITGVARVVSTGTAAGEAAVRWATTRRIPHERRVCELEPEAQLPGLRHLQSLYAMGVDAVLVVVRAGWWPSVGACAHTVGADVWLVECGAKEWQLIGVVPASAEARIRRLGWRQQAEAIGLLGQGAR